MSYAAINWTYRAHAVLKGGLTPTDLAVLRALCWFCEDQRGTRWTRNCYPSVARLAQVTGLKETAVHNAKKRLQDKGLIMWERGANFGEAAFQTNRYEIMCPDLKKALKANERRRRGEEEFDARTPPLKPGALYYRPDEASLSKGEAAALSPDERAWLGGALEFALDTPEHRASLIAALKACPSLDAARRALARVRRTSRDGRPISNRIGYLLAALRNVR